MDDIGRMNVHAVYMRYLLSHPVSLRLQRIIANIANVYRERIEFREWMGATEPYVQRSEKSDFNKRDNSGERGDKLQV